MTKETCMQVLAVRGALPEHRYAQKEITDAFAEVISTNPVDDRLLRRLHGNAGVEHRHLVQPLDAYGELRDFGHANDLFIEAAVRLGSQALRDALDAAGVAPHEVDVVMATTVTGLAVPSIDARIAAEVGLRPDVKRWPLVGLGCVAGAAGLARLHDHLVGHPDDVAVLVTTEICSLTVQRDDTSVANLVASGLFGDGAAAVVARGSAGAPGAIEVLGSRSRMYPDSERAMGWDVTAGGLRIVLDVSVPGLVETYLRDDVTGFLADHGLGLDDVAWWACHPGGPKVLEAVETALDLPRRATELTWESLARIGNLSSASVLHVLEDTLRDRPPAPGSWGLVVAMGPGFCSELVLARAGEPA
jgi:alkylresorcinol/alkylpyrone synthase